VWEITGTYVDPCTDHTLVAPRPGPGVDELAADLASMPGTVADPPVSVTIDGYRGKAVEVTVATDITTCGIDSFWLWASPDGERYVNGSDETNRIFVVDVDGERLTFAGRFTPATTTADRAELEAVIASIRIEP
jgi:predicted amidohydrolase